jgi:double-stranded uracil-DNA glycosylase
MILPDVLVPGLDLVLCGTAPGRASMQAAAYYAKPGNMFWPVLHRVGLIPVQLRPDQYRQVLDYGIGLTDLNKTEWGSDAELSPGGFDVAGFCAKIARFRPAAVAFDSKTAARAYYAARDGGRRRGAVAYGRQPEDLHGAALFVVPSPSGRARSWWDEAPWRDLGDHVAALRAARLQRVPEPEPRASGESA